MGMLRAPFGRWMGIGEGRSFEQVPGGGEVLLALVFVLTCLAGVARPADYYVDFGATVRSTCTGGAGSCSDACAGTAQVQSGTNGPWCRLPGTRTADDSGWVSPSWGTFTQANRIPAGTTIWIKGGTTHASPRGGRVIIGTCEGGGECPGGETRGFWGSGTPSSPIQIRNGAGLPTPWGSGTVTIDCANMTISSQYQGCLQVAKYSYDDIGDWIWIRGQDASNRIRLTNSREHGIFVFTDNYSGNKTVSGFVLEWFQVDHSGQFGVSVRGGLSITYKNGIANNNGSTGVAFGFGGGGDNLAVLDGTMVDVESYANGGAGGGNHHGFNCFNCGTAAQAAVVLRGRTHNNLRDGADNGLLTSGLGTTHILYLDLESYDNGEDGVACNGGTPCTGCSSTCSVVNARIFNNTNDGTCTYERGAAMTVTNSVLHNNGDNPSLSSAGCHGASGDVTVNVRNSICYRPKQAMRAWGSCGGEVGTVVRRVENSIYIPRNSDSDAFSFEGTYDTGASTGFATFSANKLGISSPNYDDPKLFVATSDTAYGANDYRPSAATTAAIDAGNPYCRVTTATGSGTTFTVDCDPRLYFFVAANRPLVAADVAYIGSSGQRCTISALSALQITCSNSVSWTVNAPVSRTPIAGATIDIGAFEYGSAAPPPPPPPPGQVGPPRLLSVEPVP